MLEKERSLPKDLIQLALEANEKVRRVLGAEDQDLHYYSALYPQIMASCIYPKKLMGTCFLAL